VRNFARAAGCPAKTDALDAQMLAHYGTVFAVAHPVAPPVEKQADLETLKDLLRQRKPLVDQRVQERHRLDKGLTAGVHNSTQRHIQWLDEEIKRLDQAYQPALAQSPRLAAQAALYQSLPGVGALTAAMLVGYRPELGHGSRPRWWAWPRGRTTADASKAIARSARAGGPCGGCYTWRRSGPMRLYGGFIRACVSLASRVRSRWWR